MKKKKAPVEIEKEKLVDLIIDIPFFDVLQGNELDVIARHMNFFEIEAGEILFNEGDPGDYVCFVVSGALDVIKEAASPENNVVIATVQKNRSIGEMSVIDNSPRSATVRARTKTSIVALTKRGFDTILEKNPEIGISILKKIARLVSMNLRKTSSRLADYMLPIT